MDEQSKPARDIPRKNEEPQQSNSEKTGQAQQEAAANHGAAAPHPASAGAAELNAGEEPSGYRGENPSTAGTGSTGIHSATPENAAGRINPSAPGDTGTTPNTNAE